MIKSFLIALGIVLFFVGCGGSSYTPKPIYKAKANPEKIFLDNDTGLMWRDDKRPPFYSGTLKGTKPYCENLTLNNFSDWRIPTIQELVTLIDYNKNTTYVKGYRNSYRTMIKSSFKGLQILPTDKDNFMSSTLDANEKYLGLSYRYGTIYSYNPKKSKQSRIICVRGQQKSVY